MNSWPQNQFSIAEIIFYRNFDGENIIFIFLFRRRKITRVSIDNVSSWTERLIEWKWDEWVSSSKSTTFLCLYCMWTSASRMQIIWRRIEFMASVRWTCRRSQTLFAVFCCPFVGGETIFEIIYCILFVIIFPFTQFFIQFERTFFLLILLHAQRQQRPNARNGEMKHICIESCALTSRHNMPQKAHVLQ